MKLNPIQYDKNDKGGVNKTRLQVHVSKVSTVHVFTRRYVLCSSTTTAIRKQMHAFHEPHLFTQRWLQTPNIQSLQNM